LSGANAIAVGAVTGQAVVAYSNNSGQMWGFTPSSQLVNISSFTKCCISGTIAVASGASSTAAGIVYASADAGQTFFLRAGDNAPFTSCYISGNNGVAVSPGLIAYTQEAGVQTLWKIYYVPSTTTFNDCCVSGNNAIAVGQITSPPQGVIFYSNGLGDGSWLQSYTPPQQSFVSCSMSGSNAVAVGMTGQILYSLDAGKTWSLGTPTYAGSTFSSCFITGSNAIAVGQGQPTAIYSVQPGMTCFKEGTKILTGHGYLLIQDLKPGDLVQTLCHGLKAISMIGKKTIYHACLPEKIKDQLYVCRAPEYSDVFEDLVLTGCHSILVEEFASDAQREKVVETLNQIYVTDDKYRLPVCNDDRASVFEPAGTYTVYHLALENDDYYMNYGVYANGLLVETCSKRYLKELSEMTLLS
jgi:photosystem II stability/assembly factor-like uncharacterized protein